MRGFLVRVLISAFSLWVASIVVDGVHFATPSALLWSALLLGIVNAVVRPIFVLLTLPFTIITLGLFLFVVNATMLGIVAWCIDDFSLDGFGAALFGAVIVSLTSMVASWTIGPAGKYELVVVRRDKRRTSD